MTATSSPPRSSPPRSAPPPDRPGRLLGPALALPGIVWLFLFFVAPLYVVLAVVFGGVDPVFRTVIPVWNPILWSSDQPIYVLTHIVGNERHLRPGPAAHGGLRADRERAVPGDRVPDRLLRRAAVGPVEGAAAHAADRAVLDQLHDADAGLGEPARQRRHRQPGPLARRGAARRHRVALGEVGRGDPRARLRLRPLHDHPVVRRPRPAAVRPHRERTRPRRQPVLGVLAGHLADVATGGDRERAADLPADAR